MVKGDTKMAQFNKFMREMLIDLYKNHGWTIQGLAKHFKAKERTITAIVEKREQTTHCLCCGKKLEQTPGHRQKEFCSPACYRKWRKLNVFSSTAKHKCQWCGKEFIDPYHLDAKYCSRACRDKAYQNK